MAEKKEAGFINKSRSKQTKIKKKIANKFL